VEDVQIIRENQSVGKSFKNRPPPLKNKENNMYPRIIIEKRTREEADRILTEKAEKKLAEVKRKTKKVKLSEYEVLDLIHDATRKDRLEHFEDIEKLKDEVRGLKRQLKEITLFSLIKQLFKGE